MTSTATERHRPSCPPTSECGPCDQHRTEMREYQRARRAAALTVEIQPRPNEQWKDHALCAQIGGDLWFPEKGGSTREAKQVCRRCPVTAECLDYALAHQEQFGIYGGLSERERRPLERRGTAA